MELLSWLNAFLAPCAGFFALFLPAMAALKKDDGEDDNNDGGSSDDDRADDRLLADFRFNINELMQDRSVDMDALKSRVGELERRIESGESVEEPLTQDYLTLAIESQDEEHFDEALEYYLRAIRTLNAALAKRQTPELHRMLGLARLSYAVMLNDVGRWAEALVEYRNAAEAMTRLAESGDLEAKLDLAGINLNVATIHFEIGDDSGDRKPVLERIAKVRAGFESLLGTEKEDEARFYLAKALTLESSVYEEEGEIASAVPRIEEAVALLRTLLAAGHRKYEADLASALAVSADLAMDQDEFERALPTAVEASALFRELIGAGRPDLCADLFDVALREAKILFLLDKKEESLAAYDRLSEEFETFRDSASAEMLAHLAAIYSGRASVLLMYGEERFDDAVADWSTAIDLYDKALVAEETEQDADTDAGRERRDWLRFRQMLERISRGNASILLRGDKKSASEDLRLAEEAYGALRDFLADENSAYREALDELTRHIDEA